MSPGDTLDEIQVGMRDGEVVLILGDLVFAMSPVDALVAGNALVLAAQVAGQGAVHETPTQVM